MMEKDQLPIVPIIDDQNAGVADRQSEHRSVDHARRIVDRDDSHVMTGCSEERGQAGVRTLIE
jgi:hypothetical protein